MNPLHFEDLEPHRFEDLVRQLAYKFRTWRYLDATGRLGRDGGLDIRGMEVISASSGSVTDADQSEEDDSDERADAIKATLEERSWSIQCKRYKEIGPKLMAEIVGDTITDPNEPPYGLIVAAACDVSAETIAAFRTEAFARGVTEAHLWTKAHLEDLLFLPENDHLLFAYFDISLGIRRRSTLQRRRERIALKRKLLRAFKQEDVTGSFMADVLVIDHADTNYPYREQVSAFETLTCPPWHPGTVESFHGGGLFVWRFSYDGWVKDDDTWDLLNESKQVRRMAGRQAVEYWKSKDSDFRGSRTIIEQVTAAERRFVREVWFLPYKNILEVDPIGDPIHPCPHLICQFDGPAGPYIVNPVFVTTGRAHLGFKQLNSENRRPLFSELRSSASRDGSESIELGEPV